MKPIWKWVIGIATLLILCIAIGAWYLSRHWKPILGQQLKEVVVSSSDSLYRISYDDIDLNLLTGNIMLNKFELIPDTAVYNRLKLVQQAPDNIYHIRVDRLRVRRFHPRQVLMGKRLEIEEIIFDHPYVHIRNEYQAYNDTVSTSTQDSKTLYESISNTLSAISIGDILLNNIDFQFTKVTDTTANETRLAGINLHVQDILIDSLSQFDSTRFLYTRGIDLAMAGTRYDMPDSLYYVSFENLNVRTAGISNEVLITGLEYAPSVTGTQFYQTVGYAKTMADLSFDTIRLKDIDIRRFLNSQRLHANTLQVLDGTVDISNDIRYGRKTKNHIGNGPHQQLMRLKQNFHIDSAYIDRVDVSYAEISATTGKEGKITFDRTSGTLYNISNDSLFLSHNKEMKWDMTTYMMNTGKLSVLFTFDMLDDNGAYTYKGKLGAMNGRVLNRIILPLLDVEVASANIQGLSFDVNATDTRARGSLRFDYTNLKASILGDKAEDGTRSSRGLLSFVANSFIINDSNPDANGVYHPGPINFSRPADFSFWKYTWQALLDGIKPSVGISAERERRLQNAAGTAKTAAERTGNFIRGLFQKKEDGTD